MKVQTTGAAMIVAAMLAGCASPYSGAPLATNFPTSKQEKVQAAAHWNVIAKDVAVQISTKLAEKRPLHVLQPAGKSSFERAFANQPVSSLVARMIELKYRNSIYVKRSQGELMLTREIKELAQTHDAQAVIVGTYGQSDDYVFVNLKVIQPATNIVLAVQDYVLPLDASTKSLLRAR